METAVAEDNALRGRAAYVMSASMREGLKTTEKAANTAQFIWDENNRVNGYPALVSEQITDGDMFFANWSDLLVGMFGGLDLLVDPYTFSRSGTLRIVAHQSVDIALRHPESFAFNNDGV